MEITVNLRGESNPDMKIIPLESIREANLGWGIFFTELGLCVNKDRAATAPPVLLLPAFLLPAKMFFNYYETHMT